MMIKPDPELTVGDLGEKALIEEYLRPLFNRDNDRNSVGDDCAAVEVPGNSFALISTDRVPSDLISFRTGVLDYQGLGRYLGVLNLSDIAACGGRPLALLFNCGVPAELKVADLLQVSIGLQNIVEQFGAYVVGGDITSSRELSISATVLGYVERDRMLRRRGAQIGDSVFVSRPVGLTPVALDWCLNPREYGWLPERDRATLEGQFKRLDPEILLGRRLLESNWCTACMDNTDGVGQSLLELARESNCAIKVFEDVLGIETLVVTAATERGKDTVEFALGPGADFSLVGTLAGDWTQERADQMFGPAIRIIGTAEAGSGVFRSSNSGTRSLIVQGWNYFVSTRA
jgi:thiamine-monophosphate kinase